MKLILPFCLTVFLAWNLLADKPDCLEDKNLASNFLGRVGDKDYSVAMIPGGGNWTRARSYCQEIGMTLAKIETTDELNFLNSKHQSAVFNGLYWTAARDSHQPQQFVWDDNDNSITADLSWRTYGELETKYLSCAAFSITAVNRSEMWMVNCDMNNLFVLCEKLGTQII